MDYNGFDEKNGDEEVVSGKVDVNKNNKDKVEEGNGNQEDPIHTKGPFTEG